MPEQDAPPRSEPFRRRARARLLAATASVAGVLPGGLVRAALTSAGRVVARGRHGELTRANLELALGDELSAVERERIALGVFRHAARQLDEWLRLSRGAPPDGPDTRHGAWIDDVVTIDPSIEKLESRLARGNGAIVVTAHIGNWELLCAALRRRGIRGAVVGRLKTRDSSANWLPRMRRGYGVETLPQDSSPRHLMELLHAGGTLGLLADLEVRRLDGEFLPFFGVPALTMTAPAALARAHGVPLVPARCVAIDDRHYGLFIDDPLEFDASLPRRDATIDLTRRLAAVYERWIRATPEQWAWHQPRWRTRPGEYDAVPLAERNRINASRSSD